jgi:hypothetical protein
MGAAVFLAAGTSVYADHGFDPAAELSLWQMIAVAAVVLVGFAATRAIRRRLERRRAPRPGDRSEPAP